MSSVDIDYQSPFRMVVDNQTENGVLDPNKFVHDKNYYVKELRGCRDSRVESTLDVASAAIESIQQGFNRKMDFRFGIYHLMDTDNLVLCVGDLMFLLAFQEKLYSDDRVLFMHWVTKPPVAEMSHQFGDKEPKIRVDYEPVLKWRFPVGFTYEQAVLLFRKIIESMSLIDEANTHASVQLSQLIDCIRFDSCGELEKYNDSNQYRNLMYCLAPIGDGWDVSFNNRSENDGGPVLITTIRATRKDIKGVFRLTIIEPICQSGWSIEMKVVGENGTFRASPKLVVDAFCRWYEDKALALT